MMYIILYIYVHTCMLRLVYTHFGTLCLKHISALGWNTDEVWMCLPNGSTSSAIKLLFGRRACAKVRGQGSTWSRSTLPLTPCWLHWKQANDRAVRVVKYVTADQEHALSGSLFFSSCVLATATWTYNGTTTAPFLSSIPLRVTVALPVLEWSLANIFLMSSLSSLGSRMKAMMSILYDCGSANGWMSGDQMRSILVDGVKGTLSLDWMWTWRNWSLGTAWVVERVG